MATPTADTLMVTAGRVRAGRRGATTTSPFARTPTPIPAVGRAPFRANRVLSLNWWFDSGDRYYRYIETIVFPTTGAAVWGINCRDLDDGGGALVATQVGTHTLVIDGVQRPEFAYTQTSTSRGQFAVDLAQLAPGWRRVQVREPDGTTGYPAFCHIGNDRVDTTVPVTQSTYELIFWWGYNKILNGTTTHTIDAQWGYVPDDSLPIPVALPGGPRLGTPFAANPTGAAFKYHDIQPRWGHHMLAEYETTPGKFIRTTFGLQSYFYTGLLQKYPTVALIDGPRGVGRFSFVMHVHIGDAPSTNDPHSPRFGNFYVVTPWSVMRVTKHGDIKTLFGWRTKTNAQRIPRSPFRATPPNSGLVLNGRLDDLELVGNWSAIQAAGGQVGLHEAWGLLVDQRTVAINTAEPAPEGGDQAGRAPHAVNVVMFVTDTANDRIIRAEFSRNSHAVEPTITVLRQFPTGTRPWDIVGTTSGRAAVSLQDGGGIVEIDLDTGATLRTIVSGDASGLPASPTLEQRRSIPTLRPEGLYMLRDANDAPEWLYYGSISQHLVRRMNWATGAIEDVADLSSKDSNKSAFMKFAVSKGDTGPRGQVYVVTWVESNAGLPFVFKPDGTEIGLFFGASLTTMNGFGGHFARQKFGYGVSMYAQGVAADYGQVVIAGMDYGMTVATLRDPSDTAELTGTQQLAIRRGYKAFHDVGPYWITDGSSPYGVALPWGINADVDDILTREGHVQ